MYKIYIYLKENTPLLHYRDQTIDTVNDNIYSRYENTLCRKNEICERFTAGGMYNNHSGLTE